MNTYSFRKDLLAVQEELLRFSPQHFTEDTLLSAMETAGKEDMPEDVERKGLGTPATRACLLYTSKPAVTQV